MGKLLVLLGAIAGIASFFLPLIIWQRDDVKASFSGFRFVAGISSTRELLTSDKPMDPEREKQVVDDANKQFEESRSAVFTIYAPVGLLVLVGLLAMATRLGRFLGVLALLAGAGAFFFWWALNEGIKEKGGVETSAGLGMTLILAVAGGGVLGGLFALVKPDRKAAAA